MEKKRVHKNKDGFMPVLRGLVGKNSKKGLRKY